MEETVGLSVERTKKDIEVMVKVPHSVNQQDELKKVRDYLLLRLSEMGLKPEVFTYKDVEDKCGGNYRCCNC